MSVLRVKRISVIESIKYFVFGKMGVKTCSKHETEISICVVNQPTGVFVLFVRTPPQKKKMI